MMGVEFRSEGLWPTLRRWGPLVLWMGVMSSLSTDAFSAEKTAGFLLPVLHWLLPDASPAALALLHGVVRKGAHVTEFAILALLWYRALNWHGTGWQNKVALTALLLAAGIGALDEAHQLLVPSRTPSVVDVGWDSLGAALGLLIRHAIRI
jgi:VanZ family protein